MSSSLFTRPRSPQRWRRRAGGPRKPRWSFLNFIRAHIPAFKFHLPHFRIPHFGRALFIIAIVLLLGGAATGAGFVAWVIRDLPNPGDLARRTIPLSTKIYDRTGKVLLYDIHGLEKRTILTDLKQVPDHVKWAIISIEDQDFYNHKGFDLRGIARAIFKDIVYGGKVQGGSTITQQFIKNSILTSEKTLTRKLKELILAYEIEKKYTKDQILLMYLNEIPYGSTIYGIEAAAQTFFGKTVTDITPAEGAMLAAIPQAPTYYSPYGNHRDELEQRQRWILDQMVKQGRMDSASAEKAKQQTLTFQPKREAIVAPHFVFYVRELLTEQFGEKMVEEGGLRVTTTLDAPLQKIAEETIAKQVPINEKQYNAGNAALVALDPKNGQVLTMVGSRDYFDTEHDGQVNVVLRPRQPGSSFKPIVYAAAFLKGYTPDTILFDVETTFKTQIEKNYAPKNYNGKEYGPVTVRKALAGSLNIPAVKMIYLTGVDQVLDLAVKMGYTTLMDRSRFGLSLVLGGGEIKLLEHAAAFGIFATEGMRYPTVGILKVEDQSGRLLFEWKQPKGERVFDTETARLISGILSNNSERAFIFGEKNSLTLGDRPVAAKTGTTNDFHDAWTIGYTPTLVTGVWVGNNNNAAMKKGGDGSKIAAPIWNAFMKAAHKKIPVTPFTVPAPIEGITKPVLIGQATPELKVKIDRTTGKLATDRTPSSSTEERTYREVHDILYYVNKEDPRGPTPTNPKEDPQFEAWEAAVQKWAEKEKIHTEPPPTETDDIHTIANEPSLTVLAPQPGSTITGEPFAVQANASAPRGIKRLEVWLDAQLLTTLTIAPFETSLTLPPDVQNGFHQLKVRVFDDVDNEKDVTMDVNVLR